MKHFTFELGKETEPKLKLSGLSLAVTALSQCRATIFLRFHNTFFHSTNFPLNDIFGYALRLPTALVEIYIEFTVRHPKNKCVDVLQFV